MQATEHKLGRVFHLRFEAGDDFYGEFNRFVKEKNIRRASVFVFGALEKTEMVSGFKNMEGFDLERHEFNDWRELLALGNITWPEKPPAILAHLPWDEPQPYVHLHMAISGPPGHTEKVLAGHLSDGIVKGMFADVYELV